MKILRFAQLTLTDMWHKLAWSFFTKLAISFKPVRVYHRKINGAVVGNPVQVGIVALLVLIIIEPLRKAVTHYV